MPACGEFPAIGTDALQPQLTMLHEESGGDVLYSGDDRVMETMRPPAVGAGKMRMALVGPAVMSQFKMPGAVFQIGLMYQIAAGQRHQRAVDRGFIGRRRPDSFGDLFLCKRLIRLQQDRQNLLSWVRFPKSAGLQQFFDLMENILTHG
jgi:hypothetical protein